MDRESDKKYHSGLNLIKYLIVKIEKGPKAFATHFLNLFMFIMLIVFIIEVIIFCKTWNHYLQ